MSSSGLRNTAHMRPGTVKSIRIGFAALTWFLAVYQFGAFRQLVNEISAKTSVGSVPYNDGVRHSIELLIQDSSSWADASLLLLGALATLWVAKADEVRLLLNWNALPEILMWIASVSLLLAAVYCHREYVDGVASALEAGGRTSAPDKLQIANVFDEKFEGLRSLEFDLLVSGALAGVLGFFSVRNLSEGA